MKKIFLSLILSIGMAVAASDLDILSAATGTGAGSGFKPRGPKRAFVCHGTTSAGAGAATIKIQYSQDGTNWDLLGTIDLTLATTVATGSPGIAGFSSDAPWKLVRANVTAISGTGASVTCKMGAE